MFGSKKGNAPVPLNDSGRSLISETFSLEGTLRTSGAIDIAGLIKGPVYTNDLVIKETGSIVGPVETDKIEIYGHLEGKVVAKTIVIGNTAVVKGDILFSETLKTEEGADINGYIKKTESTSLEAAQDEFKLEEIEAFSDEIKSENLKYFVLLGMGGSSRAAKVIHRTIGGNNEFPTMVPLESTVPSTIGKALKEIDLKSTLVIVASKSGNTMEPLLTYELFKSEIVKAIGNGEAMNRFVAITDEHSPLHELSVKENFRKVFLNPKDIGGRVFGITYTLCFPDDSTHSIILFN